MCDEHQAQPSSGQRHASHREHPRCQHSESRRQRGPPVRLSHGTHARAPARTDSRALARADSRTNPGSNPGPDPRTSAETLPCAESGTVASDGDHSGIREAQATAHLAAAGGREVPISLASPSASAHHGYMEGRDSRRASLVPSPLRTRGAGRVRHDHRWHSRDLPGMARALPPLAAEDRDPVAGTGTGNGGPGPRSRLRADPAGGPAPALLARAGPDRLAAWLQLRPRVPAQGDWFDVEEVIELAL